MHLSLLSIHSQIQYAMPKADRQSELVQDSSQEFTVQDLQETRQTTGSSARIEKVLNLPFHDSIKRADRDNAIDVYISDDYMDVLADGEWQKTFTD